jgi:PleD family two-component response regulator
MARAKTRRPGTRGGGRRAPSLHDFPDDLPSAAMAAFDDMLRGGSADVDLEESIATDTTDAVEQAPRTAPPRPPPGARKPSRAGTKRRATTGVAQPPPELVVEETVLPALATLRFAVFEEGAQLATAQDAIIAAGHVVALGGSGADGAARIIAAVRDGNVDAVLVALTNAGTPIIDAALALEPRRPIVIGAVTGEATSAVRRATAAGCDLATTRPHDAERLAPIALAAARLHNERSSSLAARGNEQVLRAKLDELSDPELRGLQPFESFQRVLELEIRRARRYEYPLSVALFAVEIPPPPPPAGILGILRARAGNALIHTIRDIDLATQLDHERFLVLLPYTDLHGAAGLGRRVIAAVSAGDPVVSAGRTFPPRVVGAVAGASGGEQLSFARLMKDATRALESARRDGAELAIQP